MYNEFFGFEKNPFASRPDPAFFFNSKQHDAALRGLMFAVQARMGVVSLTGEGGTGKTSVLGYLHESLEANHIHCAFLRESRLSVNQFFANIASQLDLPSQGRSAYQIFSALYQFTTQEAQRGRTVALIVDDAHELRADIFNEILHLASLHNHDVKLVQTIFTGRPALQPTLDSLNLERLNQGAIVNLTLRPFRGKETQEYIEFRLARAGMPDQTIFPPEAIAEIQHRSGGVPAAIQALCERLLLATFSARSKICTQEILDQVFPNSSEKPPKIADDTTDAAVTRIDLACIAAPSEPEPPPMMTSLLRLVFDPRLGAARPLVMIMVGPLDPQRIALGSVFPSCGFDLPAAELALSARTPILIRVSAKQPGPALALRRVLTLPVHPTSAGLRHPAASVGEECLTYAPRVSGLIPANTALRHSTASLGEKFLTHAPRVLGLIPSDTVLCHPNASLDSACLTRVPRVSGLIPSECYVRFGTLTAGAQASAQSFFAASTVRPIHPASKLQSARIDKWPRVPLTPFKISTCDPCSLLAARDVRIQSVSVANPIGPATPTELIPSRGTVREQKNPLPLVGSFPYGPPLPATTRSKETDSYIPPPLEAWCPPSGLDPLYRRAFHLLSTGTSRETSIELPSPPSSGKWLGNVAILLLAVLAVYIAPPTIAIAADALHRGWRGAHQAVLDRAAVALNEDFRSGLDDWMNRGGGRPSWASDAAGFVHPRSLALYRPSLSLVDYQMQFVGTIDQKALGWVVRAGDFNNYYAIRLTSLKPGPTPAIGVVRYAVINGKVESQVTTPLVMSARSDTVYRVHLDVHGDRFALTIQDQLVDSWSEPKLRRGGIGFFSEPDAASRVAGVHVKGQFDMLGRLCAFLAPSGVTTYRAQLNEFAAVAVKSETHAGGAGRGGSYLASPERKPAQLDSPLWPAPEMTLMRRINCAPRVKPTGIARTRYVTRRTGISASGNCY